MNITGTTSRIRAVVKMLIKIAFLNRNENELIRMKTKKCIPPESSPKAGKHNVPWHTHAYSIQVRKKVFQKRKIRRKCCVYMKLISKRSRLSPNHLWKYNYFAISVLFFFLYLFDVDDDVKLRISRKKSW